MKEYYFYTDSTPTHSYMRYLYKYPQAEFPYARLLQENARRNRREPEFELMDSGVFDDGRYFDVEVEYAKADTDDILIRINVSNRGTDPAAIHLLPTIWFRNTWSWSEQPQRPRLGRALHGPTAFSLEEPKYGRRWLHCEGDPPLLFTENDTNRARVFGEPATGYTKDAFHRLVVNGEGDAVNPAAEGTKGAAHYSVVIAPGATMTLRLRLNQTAQPSVDAPVQLRRPLDAGQVEYPWDAAWDLAFHCVPLALVDSEFAKEQLILLLREWYMHPNGQLPAYEWAFDDVNPPVHAWAALRVYQIEKKRRGVGDRAFLERIFQKLLLNFTWWVNRKDADGMNVFQGGFLGLDNIGVFDRSKPLPTGGYLEQSDGTSWMAMYSLNMLAIAMELARDNPAYEDVASKFWEHFLYIAHAIGGGSLNGGEGKDLWDDQDGFFYDVLHLPDDSRVPLRIRSLVGLIPMLAVQTLEPDLMERLEGFSQRLEWFVAHRPDLTGHVACMRTTGQRERRLLAILDGERLRRVLSIMLDEREFLSPYGIRAISQVHRERPYTMTVNGAAYTVAYEPAESSTSLFGGNSNWRGPVWFPVNYLLVEALQKFQHYFGDDFTVECPTGSGCMLTLGEVATDLSRRLTRIFLRDDHGQRPVFGDIARFQDDPHWRDLILFHEYFHGDNGAGLGASHQTGWTALVAKLIQQSGIRRSHDRAIARLPDSAAAVDLRQQRQMI